jgi:hypothetical protein
MQVNTGTEGAQRAASLSAAAGGDFVVAWADSGGHDGSSYGVFARRFSSAGAPLAEEFQVNSYTVFNQSYPAVAVDRGSGQFVVAWQSSQQDGYPPGVLGRLFSSAGVALASEFQVNAYTASRQEYPAAAATADGRFVVAWQSLIQDDSGDGVFAQRLAKRILLDIDGNGSTTALTDGLLVLRYGFGFRGATLVTGAVGLGCTRCDVPAIEAYLAAHID